jgi:hypothetical protein
LPSYPRRHDRSFGARAPGLAYVIAVEQQTTRNLEQSDKLATLVDKPLSGALGKLSCAERSALADRARREIQTNRYPLAPRLGPLKSAFKKLAPALWRPSRLGASQALILSGGVAVA